MTKLNRQQVQAVVGHEIAHILSGDCLLSTITCSLFEFYSAILRNLRSQWEYTDGKEESTIIVPLIFIYIVFAIIHSMSYLLNIFISREREYRADAIAARLTRDPLSLAEALYIISRGWRGEGISGDTLSSIFIVNPRDSFLDEQEGFFSDILSTHPPIKKRIEILLGIAGKDIKLLEDLIKDQKHFSSKMEMPAIPSEPKWYVLDPNNNQWIGTFSLSELVKFDWLKPYTWIRQVRTDKANVAYEDIYLRNFFQSLPSFVSLKYSCPDCYHGMEEIDYEGVRVWRCISCRGYLVKRTDLLRILIREEKGFSEEVIRKTNLLLKDSKIQLKKEAIDASLLIDCAVCHKKMHRVFFCWGEVISDLKQWEEIVQKSGSNRATLLIDKCIWCDIFWLSENKLELLQCLYEKCQSYC